jgi:hypothetical protein
MREQPVEFHILCRVGGGLACDVHVQAPCALGVLKLKDTGEVGQEYTSLSMHSSVRWPSHHGWFSVDASATPMFFSHHYSFIIAFLFSLLCPSWYIVRWSTHSHRLPPTLLPLPLFIAYQGLCFAFLCCSPVPPSFTCTRHLLLH